MWEDIAVKNRFTALLIPSELFLSNCQSTCWRSFKDYHYELNSLTSLYNNNLYIYIYIYICILGKTEECVIINRWTSLYVARVWWGIDLGIVSQYNSLGPLASITMVDMPSSFVDSRSVIENSSCAKYLDFLDAVTQFRMLKLVEPYSCYNALHSIRVSRTVFNVTSHV